LSPASSLLVVVLALAIVALVLAIRKRNTAAVVLAGIGLASSGTGLLLWATSHPAVLASIVFFLTALTTALVSIVLPATETATPIFVHETGPVSVADYRPLNPLAVTALILVFVVAVVGLVLGYIALAQIKRSGEGGRSLALAAVVVGWVACAVGLLIIGGFVGLHLV